MARKFLYVIAALVVLAIGASAVYALWGNALIRAVMVPREPFEPLKPLPPGAYADAKMWIARPDIAKDNPALWTPAGVANPQASPQAAVFFIHPTSYITTFGGAHWNARLDDSETDATARRFVASQASAFNGAGGALSVYESAVTMSNCFVGGTAAVGGGTIPGTCGFITASASWPDHESPVAIRTREEKARGKVSKLARREKPPPSRSYMRVPRKDMPTCA